MLHHPLIPIPYANSHSVSVRTFSNSHYVHASYTHSQCKLLGFVHLPILILGELNTPILCALSFIYWENSSYGACWCPSFHIIQLMKCGRSPQQAWDEVVGLMREGNGAYFDVEVIALNCQVWSSLSGCPMKGVCTDMRGWLVINAMCMPGPYSVRKNQHQSQQRWSAVLQNRHWQCSRFTQIW